ncbi:MAG TPA: SH3 domain-containing protein [Thermoanaerobaculia bacterium]|jgi:TonB family protein
MKKLGAVLLLTVACSQEPATVATGTIETREPVEVLYVISPDGAKVHAKADDASEVVSTYQNGEALSVLAKNGEWAEVRQGSSSAWVRASSLGTAQEQQSEEDNPQPKFRVMPLPVTAPGATGEIYIEADVNTDGEVTNMRLLSNTTGSPMLASQNQQALRAAKFHPIIQDGERKPFKYYHKVTY